MTLTTAFEKFAALVFLMLLVGMVAFLTFIPLPPASEKAVLMIIGGLMALSTQALPKMFGSDNEAKLQAEVDELKIRCDTLKESFDHITALLVDRHVIDKKGVG